MDLKMNDAAVDLPAACEEALREKAMQSALEREDLDYMEERMKEKNQPYEFDYGDNDTPEIDLPKSDNVWTNIPPRTPSEESQPLEDPGPGWK